MFKLLQRSIDHVGSVFYRGNLAPRAEEFGFLTRLGFELQPEKAPSGVHWQLTLRHPKVGEAELLALKEAIAPPRMIIDLCASLTDKEKDELAAAGTGVTVRLRSKKGSVLRDRKNLFKILQAVMADDAVGAADHGSELFWSRAGLADELSLPGDPDVSVLYCIHAVTPNSNEMEAGAKKDDNAPEPSPYWLHTHGLGAIGAFDFDVLKPSDGLAEHCEDPFRCIAYMAIEGEARVDSPRVDVAAPGGTVRFVPAQEFYKKASPADRELYELEGHEGPRAVICDCEGFVSRLLGGRVRPSRFMSQVDPDGIVLHFSKAATDAMAQRARASVAMLAQLAEELKALEPAIVAKVGYPMDHGHGHEEHLWFEVHEVREKTLDGTLVNQPHDIKAMRVGQRGEHPVERLTDWAIMTPMGKVTPTNRIPLRRIREDPEGAASMLQILKAMHAAMGVEPSAGQV